IGARLVEHLAASLTHRAGALDGEEALRRPYLAVPVAVPAGGHARARLGARAVAGGAAHEGRDVDLDGAPAERFLERDFEIVPKVGAAQPRTAAAAGPRPHEIAEDVLEDVGHGRGE